MSVDNLKKYAEHCNTCDDAKARAKSIGHNDIDGHIAHAKEHGFDFSAEHVTEIRDELVASGDLTDEQLENAAGGTPTLSAISAALAVGAVTGVVAGSVGSAAAITATAGSHW